MECKIEDIWALRERLPHIGIEGKKGDAGQNVTACVTCPVVEQPAQAVQGSPVNCRLLLLISRVNKGARGCVGDKRVALE